jgi:hypothetical protein
MVRSGRMFNKRVAWERHFKRISILIVRPCCVPYEENGAAGSDCIDRCCCLLQLWQLKLLLCDVLQMEEPDGVRCNT